ncbi:MAG: hypothetical protein HY751_11930 [Nitrospinae bacterium]|nr:hypothetical protein [Nitrospinota bacterium]
MYSTAKVLANGLIELPAEVMERLDIREGDALVLGETRDGVLLKKGKTILDYAGVITHLGSGSGAYRERLIQEVAREYAKGKRDTLLIFRILSGDYRWQERFTEEFTETTGGGMPYTISPSAILETVNVLEAVYKFDKTTVAEVVESILNTPFFHCEMDDIFRKALKAYVEREVKFGDAVMVYWGFWTESLPFLSSEAAC